LNLVYSENYHNGYRSLYSQNKSELLNKECRDKFIDANESTNSIRNSINRSISRSPKKISLINLKPISEEKCNFSV